jgi:hypothetical protein
MIDPVAVEDVVEKGKFEVCPASIETIRFRSGVLR